MTPRTLPLLLTTVGVLIPSCAPAPDPAVGDGPCDEVVVRAELPPVVRETSGIAASRRHHGVYWTHQDSGGDSAVFAIDSTGAVLARVRVRGAANRDWEDIELAACDPGGERDCLFIGDIGDNRERRDRIVVYRVPEPDPYRDTVSQPAHAFLATYPGPPADAEALFVTDRGIHIVTKGRSGPVELYRLPPPHRPGTTRTLHHVQTLAPAPTNVSEHITAAAAATDGRTIAVRGYATIRFYEPEADTFRLIAGPGLLVVPRQMQGESVDFLDDGRLVLTGEATGRIPATLAFARCPLTP